MENAISIPLAHLRYFQTSFPEFWELKTAINRLHTIKSLEAFYVYVLTQAKHSHSQLFQDVFVDFVFLQATNRRFLEFGATDGVALSNTLMLEARRNWRGVLAEPDPQWHTALRANRPDATILTDCIYSRSCEDMAFLSSAVGALSSLQEHARDDANGPLAGNAQKRLRDFREVRVKTIALNEVFETQFGGQPIEYMSVDTEGSELEILSSFDFGKYGPAVVTVEHNYTDAQPKLDALFARNGYARIFSELTGFDAWYVKADLAQSRQLI